MKTETLYAMVLPSAAILLAVFAIWLRIKVNSIQKEQDTLRRERIARDRALERVRRFEEMENRRFEKSHHLNLEQRNKRKKRVLAQLCICEYKSNTDDAALHLETIVLNDYSENQSVDQEESFVDDNISQQNTNESDGNVLSWMFQGFANLFEKKVEATEMLPDIADGVCAICLDDYEDGDEVCYPRNICGHVMHSECLIDWLMRNAECPICRATILKSSQVETADEENQ